MRDDRSEMAMMTERMQSMIRKMACKAWNQDGMSGDIVIPSKGWRGGWYEDRARCDAELRVGSKGWRRKWEGDLAKSDEEESVRLYRSMVRLHNDGT